MSNIKNKTILIFGGTGSLGNELVSWFKNGNTIVIFSRDELKQSVMRSLYPFLHFILGDVRSRESVDKALRKCKPHIIIIASALKQIDTCEVNTFEAIQTNTIGVNNIVESVKNHESNVEKVLLVSTDKACHPISSYGASKYLAEKLMIEAGQPLGQPCEKEVVFLIVRYGNVLNSRGSLLPKYDEISRDEKIPSFPVTDRRMTRFFMLLSDSVLLIDTALTFGKSGEIWVPILKSFRIYDIAEYYAKKYNKKVEIIGHRMCEKIHETLISDFETEKTVTVEIDDRKYYVIKPFYSDYSVTNIFNPYTSENVSDNLDII